MRKILSDAISDNTIQSVIYRFAAHFFLFQKYRLYELKG